MKKFVILPLLISVFLQASPAHNFKFAFVTDVHVGSSTSEEDLKKTIPDINKLQELDFVLLTSDRREFLVSTIDG